MSIFKCSRCFLAPCLPSDLTVNADCKSDGAAVVSWNATYGPANFSLTTSVNGSLQTLCTTQQNSCNVTGLTCGATYSLSLTASNSQCDVTAPLKANITTRESNVCIKSSTSRLRLWVLFKLPPCAPLFRSVSSSTCICGPAVRLQLCYCVLE